MYTEICLDDSDAIEIALAGAPLFEQFEDSEPAEAEDDGYESVYPSLI